MEDVTLKALENLGADELGQVLAAAVNEEIVSHEELGKIIRGGRLDALDDLTVGSMVAHALDEEIIQAADLLLMVK